MYKVSLDLGKANTAKHWDWIQLWRKIMCLFSPKYHYSTFMLTLKKDLKWLWIPGYQKNPSYTLHTGWELHSHRNLFTWIPILVFDLNLFLKLIGLIGVKSKLASLEITVCLTVTHLLKKEIGLGKNNRKKKLVLDEWILLWDNSPW